MLTDEFAKAYSKAIEYLTPEVRNAESMKALSVLNYSMHPDRFDMLLYLQRSLVRFQKVVAKVSCRNDELSNGPSWLEVGCLFPAFPIAMSILGARMTVVERYSFYHEGIIRLYERVADDFGITFVDMDITAKTTEARLDPTAYDYASCLAVLEHLPYTPRYALERIRIALKPDSRFYCEVPNFYYWGNIARALSGGHMQAPIEAVFRSDIPFVGHHREYTVKDLKYVVQSSGFDVSDVMLFNYSIEGMYRIHTFVKLWPATIPRFRETILVECKPS